MAIVEKDRINAEKYFQQTVKLSQTSPDMLASLASMRAGQNQLAEAQQLIAKAEALNPKGVFVRMTKAELLFVAGQRQQAQSVFSELERELPGHPTLAFMQGINALNFLNDPQSAKKYFETALAHLDQYPATLSRNLLTLQIAGCNEILGDFATAQHQFESLLKDPLFYGQAYQQLAICLRAQQDYAGALEAFTAYLTIQPDAAKAPQVQAQYRLYFLLNQSRQQPDNVAVLNDLALIYQQRQERQAAQASWQHALEREPANPVVLYNFGSFYLSSDAHLAADLLGQAVTAKPDYVKAWYNLGLARKQLGDTAGARTAWEKVLQLEPENQEARAALLRL